MKKRALRKDFYMEIRRSMGRFLSIFFIVAMGVAFLSGIRASEPDMRYSADAYFDRNHLMDIKVMGTLGLTDKDVEAIRSLDGVSEVEPGYSADVMVERDGNQKVLHVSSILDSMNQYTVEEGRMPKKDGECLIDQDFIQGSDLKIGDEITLISGTKDPVTDTFSKETFRIVGTGSSPEYISFQRGSSTIGNGEVSGFLAVPKESFVTEAYTECYVSVEGAAEETAFTEAYDQKVEKVVEEIESIGDRQGALRAEEIREDANEELADAKAELEEGKKTAEKELLFYDKGKEQGSNNKNIARCEFRIKKVRRCFGRSVTASMLYDPSFWNDLLDRFLSCYSKVKVSKESLPLDKINGIKILKDCALCDYVNRNGFDPLRSGFKARVRDGELAQRACKSIIEKIKKCCFSSQGKDVGREIEEFDVKFRSFLKLKRFD